MPVKIRDASPDDAEAWRALQWSIAGERPSTMIRTQRELEDVEQVRKRFFDVPEGTMWRLVAEDEGKLVGTASLQRGAREADRHVGVVGIGLAAGHRGAGLGRTMMLALEERARANGITKLTLGVATHNARAIRLYASMGYRVEGVRIGQYVVDGDKLDEMLMAKDL